MQHHARRPAALALGVSRKLLVAAAHRLLGLLAAATSLGCAALDIRFEPVAPGVYAYVGDIGPRSVANEGVNANIGLVVTPRGALLIDSGATYASARVIDAAVRKVTAQPVRWVVNTGGQDHRWLGNGWFRERGAEIIAHAAAVPDMKARGGDQLAALRALLGPAADGTVPVFPSRLVEGSDVALDLGGTQVELRYRGGAHTPGDLLVWLPREKVLFAGDAVYVDRLPAIIPATSTRRWLDTFAAIERLQPTRIVPGHGTVTDLATARLHTRAYLDALRGHMRRAVDAGTDLDAAVKSFDGTPFMGRANAAELMGANANRVYLEIERE
jgi:glyoxylase-like metal-dependent hydrolase (beta-lactamase superfamily II)